MLFILPPTFFDPSSTIKHWNKGELFDGVETLVKVRNGTERISE